MDILILPIAPQAVFRLLFAPEANAGQALSPAEALHAVDRHQGLTRVELKGPGDPLATIAATLETITILRKRHPQLHISLTTLGIGGEQHTAGLAAAGLGSINLLVDTLDPALVVKLYAWIRPGKKTVPLSKVAPLLLEEQRKTAQAMALAGIGVTIRTTVYPGINAQQVAAVAETMAACGARAMELVPFTPGPQQVDCPVAPTRRQMAEIEKLAGQYLATRSLQASDGDCAAGGGCGTGVSVQPGLPQATGERPRVAVVSSTGMDVDLHLGQAKTILIYGPRADGLTCLLETRRAPEAGSGETRWEQLAEILHDCFVLLAASAGQRPREVLGSRGIRVLVTEENIEGTVDVLYGGGKKQKCKK
jgi:nitrogen fixation protein NifB